MSDTNKLRGITAITLTVLLCAMFLPGELSGRFLSAYLLLPLAVVTRLFIKKRSILSINKRQVLFLFIGFGSVYVLLYYLFGIRLGFTRNIYFFNLSNLFNFIVPIALIIVTTELIRAVVLAQENKLCDILCWISCIIAEALICGNIYYITSFNRFMELFGTTLIPAVVSNLLYHYISKRYGAYPNIAYRLISTLYLYVLPYVPGMAQSLFALYNMAFPAAMYVFISALYDKKRRYAMKKSSKAGKILNAVTVILLVGVIMLISNQFRYGTLVVATPSMTGELNVGDAAIFEEYDDQLIVEGQVIVYEKEGSMIIHRVVEIENKNNTTRYYTKGDANADLDEGFVVPSDIVGLVHFKIPYVGYPTLWLRSMFIN